MAVSKSNVRNLRFLSILAGLFVPVALAALANGCAPDTNGSDYTRAALGEDRGVEVTIVLRDAAIELVGARAVDVDEHEPLESHDESPQFAPLAYRFEGAAGVVQGKVPDPRVVRVETVEHDHGHSEALQANYGELALRLPARDGVLTLTEAGGRTYTLDLSKGGAVTTQAADSVQFRGIDVGGGSSTPRPRGPGYAEPVTIQDANPCEGSVGVLFVPEGYTRGELGQFHSTVRAMVSTMMSSDYPDMNELSKHFAFYYLDIASNQSGISEPGTVKDTAFGLEYRATPGPDGGATAEPRNHWMVLPTQRRTTAASVAVLRGRTQTRSEVLVIVPNITEGRSNASPNTREVRLVNGQSVAATLAHEIGHAMPWLADEYVDPNHPQWCNLATAGARPNTTKDAANPKWKSFFSGAPVMGAEYCPQGVYRPAEECLMRNHYITNRFCPVCRKAFDDNFASRRVSAGRWPSCWGYRPDGGTPDARAPEAASGSSSGGASGTRDAGSADARTDAAAQPCNNRPKGSCGAGNICAWTGEGYCCRPEISFSQRCTADKDCNGGQVCTATSVGEALTCAAAGRAQCTD